MPVSPGHAVTESGAAPQPVRSVHRSSGCQFLLDRRRKVALDAVRTEAVAQLHDLGCHMESRPQLTRYRDPSPVRATDPTAVGAACYDVVGIDPAGVPDGLPATAFGVPAPGIRYEGSGLRLHDEGGAAQLSGTLDRCGRGRGQSHTVRDDGSCHFGTCVTLQVRRRWSKVSEGIDEYTTRDPHSQMEMIMRQMLLIALLAAAPGCAKNPDSDTAGARIHEDTLTAKDTIDPNDTLTHIRDTMPDSTQH
jgi:hypothetical protein